MEFSLFGRDYYIYKTELVKLIQLIEIERQTKRDEARNAGINENIKLSTTFKEDLIQKLNLR